MINNQTIKRPSLVTIKKNITLKILAFICLSMLLLPVLVFIPHSQAAQTKDSLLLKNAISLRQAGKTQQALNILEPLKTKYIDHKRVNIELAMNYISFKQYDDAQTIIHHLESLSLSVTESTKLQSLQEKLKKLILNNKSSHQYTIELFAYGGIDGTTSKFPVYEYIDFNDWQEFSDIDDVDDDSLFTRNEETEIKSNFYSAQQIKAVHRYQPHQKTSVLGTNTSLHWINSVSLYQQQPDNDYQDNYGQIKIDSTLALVQKKQWLIDLRLRGRYHFNGDQHHLTDQGAQLSLTLPIKRSQIKLGFEFRQKSFSSRSDVNNEQLVDITTSDHIANATDAEISTPWLEYAYKISTQFKIHLGTRYRHKQADNPYNSYDNLNFYMSFHYYVNSFNVFITLSHDQLHYKIDDPELISWSREKRKSIITGIKYGLTNHLSFGINSHFINNNVELDNGENEWYRFEGVVSYRF
ncbi:MAG: hypothetical protein ACI9LM_000313 [Alteromonadaceae bacterium]|jgi:hypothetical protein